MADTATASPPQRQNSRVLTKQDRCDRCGAAADIEVRSGKSNLPLMFCRHHAREHVDALAEWIVTGASGEDK